MSTPIVVPTDCTRSGRGGRVRTACGKIADGEFRVTADGAATYTLPFWVPEGRRGIQPTLALRYHSRACNGWLGMGCTVSGFSQIRRVAKVAWEDNACEPIRFDASDPFALDGERLVLTGGVHGTVGAEYRTKRDIFAKVVLGGIDNLGPTWFEARYKDGRIVTFGEVGQATRNSRVEGVAETFTAVPVPVTATSAQIQNATKPVQRQVRYAWAVSSIRDRADNEMTFSYTTGSSSPLVGGILEHVPARIEYTAGPRRPAQRSVEFVWEPRPDVETNVVSGLRIAQRQRLQELVMRGPSPIAPAVLRRYRFAYWNDSVSGRSLLASVSESDRLGVSLGPHRFEWERGSSTFHGVDTGISDVKASPAGRSPLPGRLRVADFNGDGYDDILYVPASRPDEFHILLADPMSTTGFSGPIPTGISVPADPNGAGPYIFPNLAGIGMNILVRDDTKVSGLGSATTPIYRVYHAGVDLSGWRGAPGSFVVFEGRSIFDTPSSKSKGGSFSGVMELADFNGDGLPDLLDGDLSHAIPAWSVRWNLGGNLNFDVEQLFATFPLDHLFVHLDGDASATLLVDPLTDPRFSALRFNKQGAAFIPSLTLTTLPRNLQYVFADVMGSGLQSAFSLGDAATMLPLLMENVGSSFGPPTPLALNVPAPPSNFAPLIRVLDWDQDGRSELLLRMRTALHLQQSDPMVLLKWTGSAFSETPLPAQFVNIWKRIDDFSIFEILDYNGDGLDDIIMFTDGRLQLFVHDGKRADMMTAVTDGLGARIEIDYGAISDPALHTPEVGVTYPQRPIAARVWTVAEHRDSNGIGGVNTYHYRYRGGVEDVRGLGFLGFAARTVLHAESGIVTETTYSEMTFGSGSYPLQGLPREETTHTPLGSGREQVNTRSYQYAIRPDALGKPYFVFPSTIVDETVELHNGQPTMPVRGRTTTQDMDQYGNAVQVTDTWTDGNKHSVSSSFRNDAPNWLIGLLECATETSTVTGGALQTRTRAYDYDADGLLRREILAPGPKTAAGYTPLGPQVDGVRTLFRTVDRYPDGNIQRITEDDGGDVTRFRTAAYDSIEHIFPVDVTNALGHHLRFTYHAGLGVCASFEDENGVRYSWRYDGFGRQRQFDAPDGNDLTTHYRCSAGAPQITRQTQAGTVSTSEHDVLGRVVAETLQLRHDGKQIVCAVEFDVSGRVARVSRPHFPADLVWWDQYTYDSLGRSTQRVTTDGATTVNTYFGEWMFTTRGQNRTVACRFDNQSRVIFATDRDADHVGKTPGPDGTTFAYGPFNQVRSVTDLSGNATYIRTDRWGRVIALSDPDRGQRRFAYNAFGDLEAHLSSNNHQVRYQYDTLGRLVLIQDPDGDVRYDWDTATNGIGRLARVIALATGVTVDYAYDQVGRLSGKTWTIGANAYDFQAHFDAKGRLARIDYPAVAAGKRLRVGYRYGNFGQLMQAVDVATGHVYWEFVDADASGLFGAEKLGNGLTDTRTADELRPGVLASVQTMDSVGNTHRHVDYGVDLSLNVESRTDRVINTKEIFRYDDRERLLRWHWQGAAGQRQVRWDYDDLGNIMKRAIETGPGDDLTYAYVPAKAGPHAVFATNHGQFSYDGDGRQTSGPQRTITYGREDLPIRIDGPSGAGVATDFIYDGELSRVRTHDAGVGSIDSISGLYECHRPLPQPGVEKHVHLVTANGRPVARVVWTLRGKKLDRHPATYLHVDHQGSLELVTDDTGAVVDRLKYDPFGGRVSPLDPFATGAGTLGITTGYTGHEHLDAWNLIDMKGRFYDPALGKFLTPDPFVPEPQLPSSWNRYAYVLNNPLTKWDLNGFGGEIDDKDIAWGARQSEIPANGSTLWTPGITTLQGCLADRACVDAHVVSLPGSAPPPAAPIAPPQNDNGLGGAAASGLPTSAGSPPAAYGRPLSPRDPADLFFRLDRSNAARYAKMPFGDPGRNAFYSKVGTIETAILMFLAGGFGAVAASVEIAAAAPTAQATTPSLVARIMARWMGWAVGGGAAGKPAMDSIRAATDALRAVDPTARIQAFITNLQIVAANTNNTITATMSRLPNGGAVWFGTMGRAVVITNNGRVYLGEYGNPAHFVFGPPSSPMIPILENLKQVF